MQGNIDTLWEVPAFDERIYRARSAEWAVIVPVINEGAKFLNQLDQMSAHLQGMDLVVADGGSTDGSVDDLSATCVHSVLVKRGPGGLSAQLRMAFAWCLRAGYRGVIIVDGNGKDGVDALPRFRDALAEGWDFVQGSRYVPGGVAVNTPLDRHLAVTFIHAPLVSLAAGFRYTDTTNGFRGFSAKLLSDPRVAPFREVFDTYNLHYYLSVRAARLGFRVKEIPVTRSYPAKGKTPTKISGMRGRLLILRQLASACLGLYNPPRVS